MTGRMGISALRPGMILSGDLRAYNGRLLLNSGICLSESHIRMMKMWGIVEAHVQHAPLDVPQSTARTDETGPKADLSLIQKQVQDRFCRIALDHPAVMQLYRCVLQRSGRGPLVVPHEPEKNKAPEVRKSALVETGKSMTAIPKSGPFWEKVTLPSLPDIFFAIHEAIMNPRSSAYEIADVIGKDTGLTARLLKMANSAFYAFPTPIESIHRAVTVVGAKQIALLSYAVNIIDAFKNVPMHVVDMASFWRHSVACGICARLLAGYKNLRNTERLFVAGLIHDIGRLLLYQYAPAEMGRLLGRARAKCGLLYELEHEAMNCDHMTLGSHLVRNWKLPAMLEDIVTFHHNPGNSRNGCEAAIVHVADIMTNAMGIGSSGEALVPPLDIQAWERLGLSEHTLTATIQQMDLQMTDIIKIFFPDEKKIKLYH